MLRGFHCFGVCRCFQSKTLRFPEIRARFTLVLTLGWHNSKRTMYPKIAYEKT